MIITNYTVKHLDEKELPSWMMPQRTRILSTSQPSFSSTNTANTNGSILYWMQRDVRTTDNWALLLARHYAKVSGLPLRVLYTLPPPPPSTASSNNNDNGGLPAALQDMPMTQRHGMFLVGGLEEVHKELKELDVPFHILMPESDDKVGESVDQLAAKCQANLVLCDFSPLRQFRQWHELQAKPLLGKRKIPFFQVDAHNVVPVWHASPKREVGARTLRSKINKVVSDFIQEFPDFEGNQHLSKGQKKNLDLSKNKFDRKAYETFLEIDTEVPTCDWAVPGTKGALTQFDFFVSSKEGGLKLYDQKRNDPNLPKVCSDMSPWLNHGHVAFQTLLMKAKKLNKYASGVASFVEEGLVRKELSDNYIYYTPNDYDTLEAAAGWAKETLETHTSDVREYVYSFEEFEQGKTHDDLWNAAQLQVVREGRMHGFMRMYWAKKILEWTETPEIALRTAQYLNDRFALDGKGKRKALERIVGLKRWGLSRAATNICLLAPGFRSERVRGCVLEYFWSSVSVF